MIPSATFRSGVVLAHQNLPRHSSTLASGKRRVPVFGIGFSSREVLAMAKKKRKAPARPGAQRLSVYNEGLCGYVHDEAHDADIRALLRSGTYGDVSNTTFFDNLSIPAFGAVAAKRGFAFAFELDQDDGIDIDVLVGPPLTAEQLADAHWMPPQLTWLRLPSGRLRVDSPNTMPLDPDPGEDPGGVATVPPGDYQVSLYRLDWAAMHRAGVDETYNGPGHIVLLTPLDGPPSPPVSSAILPFPDTVIEGPTAWTIDGAQFKAQVFCDFWWEPLYLNLDRAAVKQLGLAPGQLFEVSWEKPKLVITAAYAPDADLCGLSLAQTLTGTFGKELLDEFAGQYPEVAVAHWRRFPGKSQELLTLLRWEGKKPYPAKWHDIWCDCRGRRLDAVWKMGQEST
jgi:hypothetical protein